MDSHGNFDLATYDLTAQRRTSAAVAQGPHVKVASAVRPIDWALATVRHSREA
jgi:hypothetical protein